MANHLKSAQLTLGALSQPRPPEAKLQWQLLLRCLRFPEAGNGPQSAAWLISFSGLLRSGG